MDNAGPAGHDFEYVDYFPRAGLKVHTGDVVDFRWNTGSLDGAHTATLVPAGAEADVPPLIAPDADDAGGQLQFNPAVLAPTDPTCGTSTNPCDYNGTHLLNSGFIPNATGGDFYVKLDPALGANGSTTVKFLCEIHPGMQGSLTVVSDRQEASEPADVGIRAEIQRFEDTVGALIAEAQAEATAVKLNPDGKTRTITMTAGTATQFVEVVEMLPRKLDVKTGDTVNWVTKTKKDPHTVTFPKGHGSDSVDPLPSFCEGPTSDTPAVSPAACASPADFEVHFNPQPVGPTAITSPQTESTSGVISTFGPFPDHYAFSFPAVGTFEYQCRIHDNMTGTIVVR
ncbi:MAG: hypothetical protein JO352_39780 [Chloroflexi bacterium]|nr:hypothetical protein [Chloroflexota bacterium]MBV9597296.1 hypothetical protein [Chloroflexota bacterium]